MQLPRTCIVATIDRFWAMPAYHSGIFPHNGLLIAVLMGLTAAAPPLGLIRVSRAGVLHVQHHYIVGAGLCPFELAPLPHVEDIALLCLWGLQVLGGQMMHPTR